MVVVIHGTDGIVAPGLTSEDSTGTITLTTSGSATIGGPLTLSDSASITGALTASGLSYPTSDGAENKVVTTDGSGNLTFSSFGSLTPSVVSTNTTAVAGYAYYLDSDGITLTLPASPSNGDVVGVSEIAGGETSVIARNGSNIMSVDSDLTLDVAYTRTTLTYTGASVGWALT